MKLFGLIVIFKDWIYFQSTESLKFAWKCCSSLGYSRFYAYACFHQRIVLPWYSFYLWLLSFEVINLEHCCAVIIPFFYRFLTSRSHIFSLFAEYCLLMSLNLCIFGLIIILRDFCQKSYFDCCEHDLLVFNLTQADF